MTRQENIKDICFKLFEKNRAVFIGYNVLKGSRMYGTLAGIPERACVEMPCAESLMVGTAIGVSLEKSSLPVLCFERHEFALFSLGLIAVMADKFCSVTSNIKLPMVIRVIKGGKFPLNPGAQHCGNYEKVFKSSMPNSEFLFDWDNLNYKDVVTALAKSKSGIVVILEDKDGYSEEK